jgi:hypothetical protein
MVPYDIAAGSGRWIFVSTSNDDGLSWSAAELALSPDWRDGAGIQVTLRSVSQTHVSCTLRKEQAARAM